MRWSERLFIGESALSKKFKLIKAINKKTLTPFLYIIALINGELSLVNDYIFYSLYYKKISFQIKIFNKDEDKDKQDEDEVIIVGFSITKKEGLKVLAKIVETVYKESQSFSYKEYFENQGE